MIKTGLTTLIAGYGLIKLMETTDVELSEPAFLFSTGALAYIVAGLL